MLSRPTARSPIAFFLLPSALAMAVVLGVPLAYSLYYSFSAWVITRPGSNEIFIGLGNYRDILSDPEFWHACLVTAEYAIACVLLQATLGFLLALLFNVDFLGRKFFRTLMLIPMVVTPAVVGIFWKLLYQETDGIYNYFLGFIGIGPIPWLNTQWSLISIIIMDTWQSSPFFMLVILAGLQTMDESTVSAAKIDGANALQITRFITLPHLVPYVLIAAAFRSISALAEFDRMYLLTLGGPGNATTSVSLFAYRTGFQIFDMGRTTASAWIILVITFVVTAPLIAHLLTKGGENRE